MEPRFAEDVTHYECLLARLEEAFPDGDQKTLVNNLEGVSNLPDKLAEVCRSMLDDQALVSVPNGRSPPSAIPSVSRSMKRCNRSNILQKLAFANFRRL